MMGDVMGWAGYPNLDSGTVLLPRPPVERYCGVCWCSSRSEPDDPCWYCGSETSGIRPLGWIASANEQVVRGGSSFGVEELAEFVQVSPQ